MNYPMCKMDYLKHELSFTATLVFLSMVLVMGLTRSTGFGDGTHEFTGPNHSLL